MGDTIKIPKYDELQAEIAALRERLTQLYLERDELTLRVCPEIEAQYMIEAGDDEYKAYDAECKYRRMRRKVELYRAAVNRGESVVEAEIERKLDCEMEEYQAKLDEILEGINDALERRAHGKPMENTEVAELKKMYREIVKKLHPDLHPDLPEDKLRLFFQAVQAYTYGDVEGLRLIWSLLADTPEASGDDTLSEMEQLKANFVKYVAAIEEKIAALKKEYPYTLKKYLENDQAMEERKQELKAKRKEYLEAYERCKAEFEALKEAANGQPAE